MRILVTSPAFMESASIPTTHTCDGENLSPPVAWSTIPEGTQSIALLCDDPDAPLKTWVHWVVYNVPPSAQGLPQGVAHAEALPDGSRQGINDFGRVGYGGPCPPQGSTHRYFFRVYALDCTLSVGNRATKRSVEKAMEGHIVASGVLLGTYRRA
ncbi:YbhB/YbcL family Raf kinase inhibitor-like protein [Candidatus Fermentibacteria bacterium]|nr:YbhB/YbcL family Raf kinase inhibitor-like protein [Candidatus Fermentibacteria bacterium]